MRSVPFVTLAEPLHLEKRVMSQLDFKAFGSHFVSRRQYASEGNRVIIENKGEGKDIKHGGSIDINELSK